MVFSDAVLGCSFNYIYYRCYGLFFYAGALFFCVYRRNKVRRRFDNETRSQRTLEKMQRHAMVLSAEYRRPSLHNRYALPCSSSVFNNSICRTRAYNIRKTH